MQIDHSMGLALLPDVEAEPRCCGLRSIANRQPPRYAIYVRSSVVGLTNSFFYLVEISAHMRIPKSDRDKKLGTDHNLWSIGSTIMRVSNNLLRESHGYILKSVCLFGI